jgi:beta-lactamase regulating signal transducer with metallopeptidase domain
MIILSYLGKMVLCSGVLFGYYYLFLRNKRFHHYNRFFLLGSLVLSVILPLIRIPVLETESSTLNQVVYHTARAVTLQEAPAAFSQEQQVNAIISLPNLIRLIHGAGILILMITLLRSLWYIRQLSQRYPFEVVEKLKFYQTQEPGTPFSFFRSIFWNDQLNFNSAQGQQIFRHELFHVQQRHSVDILLAELICIIGWVNPFFYLIKKELKAIHEFLADQYAASGSNRYQYAEMLVQQVLSHRPASLTHPFFQNQLKRRIAMITQLNQTRYGYWSRVMVLPVSLVLFFSVTLYAQQQKEAAINNQQSRNGSRQDNYVSLQNNYTSLQKDAYHTDTVPLKEKVDEALKQELIMQQKIVLEKLLQEKAVGGDAKNKKAVELKLLKLKQELELAQNYRPEERILYKLSEAKVKEEELEKNQVKQQLLEEMLQKKEIKEDPRISKILEKELVELKALQQQKLTSSEAMSLLKLKEAAEEKQTLDARERMLLEKKLLLQEDQHTVLLEKLKTEKEKEATLYLLREKAQQDAHQLYLQKVAQDHYKSDDTIRSILSRFFNKNFRYPVEMIDNDGEGSIWYSFSLNESGKLGDFETYTEPPAAAQGNLQEIVIIAYPRKDKAPGVDLGKEKIQQLMKAEVDKIAQKEAAIFGTRKVTPGRYYYKATFRIEKVK